MRKNVHEYIFVMMKAFFLLIALYTITGKQAVPSGDIPAGATCAYEQTGNRSGQLTAGNSLMLTLSGYEGVTLHSVTLRMHSNTSSGAGALQMTIGDAPIWMIQAAPFSDDAWFGSYSKEWVDISQSFSGLYVSEGEDITLQIGASQNSLYIQSVQLNYSAPQAQTYTVSFDTHSKQTIAPRTESEPSGGILLPDLDSRNAVWQFYGWAENAVNNAHEVPVVSHAGMLYFPSTDCTLHAVYVSQSDVQPWLPTDDLLAEDYIIALYDEPSGLLFHATGAVSNNMLDAIVRNVSAEDGWVALPLESCTENDVYTLHVTGDTLTIRHKATDRPVSLASGGKFTDSSSSAKWIIKPVQDDSDMPKYEVSGIASGLLYYISYYVSFSDGKIYFRPTKDAAQNHELLLYAVSDAKLPDYIYSSLPFATALTEVSVDELPEYRQNMGSHTLIIKNGKKLLQINE